MRWLRRFPRWQTAIVIAGAICIAVLAIAGVALVVRWPFTEANVLESIRETWPGPVRAEGFHASYFPHPGCTVENLVLELPSNRSPEPARVTIASAQIRTNYADLFVRPGYLAHLLVEGLHINVPVYDSSSPVTDGKSSSTPITTRFGEVEVQDAVLVIQRAREKDPLQFDLHRVTLRNVRRGAAMSYDAALTNAEPPGEILIRGQFGPWDARKLEDIVLSGSYSFDQADLGVFGGIAGKLSSTGSFGGTMDKLAAQGSIEIPAFQLTRARHDVPISAKYQAEVNATRGDVALKDVSASFLHTNVHAGGVIASMNGTPGKTASLDVSVRHGEIQDVLKLFVKSDTPPMKGTTDFQTHVVIPPGEKPFLKKVEMAGDFSIRDSVMTNPDRQNEVELLSKRASGHKDDPQTAQVTGRVDGKVDLNNGTAVFTPLTFAIPGALINMSGRYDVIAEKIDLHGDAKTQAELSDDVTGVKAVFLKPINALFKKKNAGADVRVELTGTYNDPHFGIELPVKK